MKKKIIIKKKAGKVSSFPDRLKKVSSALSEGRCVECGHTLDWRLNFPLVTFLCPSCGWSGMAGRSPDLYSRVAGVQAS